MSTIEILDQNDCCGCSSCAQKCPKNAIKMESNEEGFLYPIIDKEKCIKCGLCSEVCPQLKKMNVISNNYPKAYAVRNKNSEELLGSSSGGFFSVLANYVLDNSGVVFGAAYDSDLNVNHIKATTKKELDLIRGSKYVQSNINNSYKDVEQALKNNQCVLFTGTPCQILGLKSFLSKEYDSLITADIVCHGVPSQKIFHKYLEYLSIKFNSKVVEYNFRSKGLKGWGLVSKVNTIDGKERYIEPDFDPYYSNFLKCVTYRNNCYKCHYANYNRVSDFTMADYWGIEKIHPCFYKEEGNSLVLINNEKAEIILDKIKKNIELIETNLNEASCHNRNLIEPSKKPEKRNNVYLGIDDMDSEDFIKKNLKCEVSAKKILKALIPRKIKNIIRKMKYKKLKNIEGKKCNEDKCYN